MYLYLNLYITHQSINQISLISLKIKFISESVIVLGFCYINVLVSIHTIHHSLNIILINA